MTKDIIKQEALLLFVNEGYEGSSMSDIAKRVKIQPSSIYAHFASKEQLFLTILQDVIDDKIADLGEITIATSNQGIKSLLYTILMSRVKEIATIKNKAVFYKRFSLFPPSQLKEIIQNMMFIYEKKIAEILIPAIKNAISQDELKKEAPEKILAAYYCVLDGLYILSHYYEMETYRSVVENVWSLYWQSVSSS